MPDAAVALHMCNAKSQRSKPSMNEMVTAIANAIDNAKHDGSQWDLTADEPTFIDMANAVLATPEMEALRKALRHWAEYAGRHDGFGAVYALRYWMGTEDDVQVLPESVIAWIMR